MQLSNFLVLLAAASAQANTAAISPVPTTFATASMNPLAAGLANRDTENASQLNDFIIRAASLSTNAADEALNTKEAQARNFLAAVASRHSAERVASASALPMDMRAIGDMGLPSPQTTGKIVKTRCVDGFEPVMTSMGDGLWELSQMEYRAYLAWQEIQ